MRYSFFSFFSKLRPDLALIAKYLVRTIPKVTAHLGKSAWEKKNEKVNSDELHLSEAWLNNTENWNKRWHPVKFCKYLH